jgi:glycosyltransferase involved in cell wall biosynthesis
MSATGDPVISLDAPPPDGPAHPGPPPTLSVIIAVYQGADFIGEAVASALEQTAPAIEVIVCDDGSTDDVEGALEPYMDRIRFVKHEENRGQSAALNEGLRIASGDFVSLLDADDVYMPERNDEILRAAAARPDLDVLTTNCHMEFEGRVVGDGTENWRFDVADQRRAILDRCFVFPLAVIRRSRLVEIGGYDESLRENDWDCWIRLIFTGSRVGRVNRPLARYRLREESLSHDTLRTVRGVIKLLEKAGRTLEMSADERAVLERSLDEARRKAEIQDAQQTLLERHPESRRRSLAVVMGRGHPLSTRLKGAFAAAAPRTARRMLLARERDRWVAAAGIVVERQASRRS